MACLALTSSGTATPRSRHACCSAPAISAVESASVPSQSKASRRKRRGGLGILPRGRIEAPQELREIRGEGRLQDQPAPLQRVRQREPPGVQEHALEPFAGERLVPREVALLVVA